ncbi:MAG TPA: hypothetical protein VEA36_00605 [Candidatus Paceibacterota bacterium]|nr:hypothetical protein [Candidatus Paceibacterota bacterium]
MDTPTSFPGPVTLLKAGLSHYKQRGRAVLTIAIAQFVIGMALGFAIVMLSALGTVGMLIGVPLALLFVWAVLWLGLAMLMVFVAEPGSLSARAALGRAAPQVFRFLWVNVLTVLVYSGILALVAGIPALVLYFVAGPVPALVAGLVLFFVAAIVTSPWFSFVGWAFADQGARGMQALLTSREMVRGRNWSVLWRMVVIGFLVGIATVILVIPFELIALALPGVVGDILSEIGSGIAQVLLAPIFVGALYALYAHLKPVAGAPTPVGNGKRYTLLAILGVLFVPAFFGFIAYLIMTQAPMLETAGEFESEPLSAPVE